MNHLRASILLFVAILSCFISSSTAFHFKNRIHASSSRLDVRERRKRDGSDNLPTAPEYVVGDDVPEEISRNKAIYDMILVERFSQPERTGGGLFMPKTEGKDEKHLGKVLSMPTYGLESEQGRLATPSEIMPYTIGDVVYIRDPWGIGPKDLEIGPRCFSFHKAQQISGVVR
jgi:co-chaperonin GroES (HSP10)